MLGGSASTVSWGRERGPAGVRVAVAIGLAVLLSLLGSSAAAAKDLDRSHGTGEVRGTVVLVGEVRGDRGPGGTGPSFAPPPVGTASPPGSLSVIVRSSFDGLGRAESGNVRPPDPALATGPYQVVHVVNYAVEVYDKQGNRLWTLPMSLRTFFGSSDTMFDPRILYDAQSGRWFVSAAQFNGTERRDPTPVKVAVSLTANLTDGWRIYDFVGRGDPDQPFIGYSDDKFAITWNGYSLNNGRWLGTEAAIVNKAQMVAGVPSPAVVYLSPDSSGLGVQPVESHGPTTTQYMVGRAWKTGTEIKYYAITGVPGAGGIHVTTALVPITKNLGSVDAEQPTTDIDLDTNTGRVRVLDASWHGNRLWFAVNSFCRPPNDVTNRSCVRFTELDTTNAAQPVLVQEFDHSETGRDVFYGAVTIDEVGNLGVLYGYSSETDFPSLAVTGRSTTDPLRQLKPPVTIVVSSAVDAVPAPYPFDNSNRYGDYFAAVTDPVDRTVVWVAGEYQPTTAWGTYVASFRIEEFTLHATPAGVALLPGGTGNAILDVVSHGGFTRTVDLSSSVAPPGVDVTLDAGFVMPPPGGTASVGVTISVPAGTSPGDYVVTITGASGPLEASATIQVTVQTPGGGGGGSVARGSLILMEDGSEVPVQNLEVGDWLLGYEPEVGEFTVSVVTAIQVVDTENLLVIHTEAGTPCRVDANPRQTLWVKTAAGAVGWRSVTDIVPGDSLFTPTGWTLVTHIEFAPAGRHVMYDIFATAPYFADGYLDPQQK